MIAELEKVKNVWSEIKEVISYPRTQKQYKKLVEILDNLIDEVGNNEKHSLAPLMETIGNIIESYEFDHFIEIESDPIEILKSLMEEHGLSQKDMKELGSQGVVSEILNGKRELNVRQIKVLSKRFNVSPAVFI
ncbi:MULTISPECIES: type II toxin-antitoxin system HigA family antitoxin [Leptospira]|uniref:DNA-binding helix-turn-helix protein n=3 Tax=Leptospira weilii TaxID=28184 RepID=A0A828YXR0_9LEPT|nr:MULTISPECIES: helix-turn-helix domain-containing protein [Leptospira]EKR63332.1 DNA-binding helix-turn-helix protein [Leptospira weilii str. 2006001853]EMJ66453.1 DNA-binding helix-turn-helix protein [Leptospira sp. P2653]EMN91455.1 DNA-binding helix-turn-helix protein [Leptospira weilii str. UI 13098]MCL8267639.1 helix-turn-helix domain-containing protein [Leptospira weilii]MDL5247379.1 helix-turn-helix domain-containing protein [Leptospira weilii]